MSNYSSLKATINANVKTNGNQEISGAVLNSVLNAMVDSEGAGYQFMGVATPSSPGTAQTPDYKCFYLASTPGTYTYLGGLVVADGEVAILKYDTAWSKEVTGAASAADLSQLGQKVGDFDAEEELTYSTPTASRYVNYSSGTLGQSGVCSAIMDVDVSGYVGKTLHYSRVRIPAANGLQGMAFMKADGTYLSGVQGVLNASVWGIELSSVVVPEGAAKARFSCPDAELANFKCYVDAPLGERVEKLEEQKTELAESVADIDTIIAPLPSSGLLTETSDWQNGTISNSGYTSSSSNTLITTKRIKLQDNAFVKVSAESGYKYRVIFLQSYGTGAVAIPAGYTIVAGDYDDAKVWHFGERLLKMPEGATCYIIAMKKVDDSSISTSDCGNVHIRNTYGTELIEDIPTLEENADYNAIGLLDKSDKETKTDVGITCEYVGDGTYHIYGTSTEVYNKTLLGGPSVIPSGFEGGKSIYLSGMTNKVLFTIYEYVNGDAVKITSISRPSIYTISEGITGLLFRLTIRTNTTLDEYVRPIVLNAYSNGALTESLKDYIASNKSIIDTDTVPRTISHNGITYTYDGIRWNVAGTSISTSWAVIAGGETTIPGGIEVGKLMQVKFSGTDVALHIVQYDSNRAVIQSTMFYSDGVAEIDSSARGIQIRLRVAADVTLNENVTPIIINHLDEGQISKELYSLRQGNDNNSRDDRIVQCAKSYYVMTRANQYTYGERSALYYGDGGPLNQVHCGALCALIASGTPFCESRYVHPDFMNESFAAGYGFDFEAYSLKLAQSGVQSEIDYIGAENVNKSVAELKELMKFKTSYKLSTSCLRWDMIHYIQSGGDIDFSDAKIGDILFYGRADDGQPKVIDGELITPVLIEGNLIGHCDTIIDIRDGVPYVIDAGSAPIRIHAFELGTYYTFVCLGRVPMFDIIM